MIYKNKKTGNLYRLLAVATDCTNSRDSSNVIVYCPDDNEHSIFVRDIDEFNDKFDPVTEFKEP